MTQVVVFDLDQVLLSGNAVRLFVRGRRDWAQGGTLRVLGAAPLLLPAAAIGRLRPLSARALTRLALGRAAGVEEVGGVYRSALVRAPGGVVADAVARVLADRAAGARVVVATAAEETLARGLLAALGLSDVDVIGSAGGLRGRRAHGATKADMLSVREFPPPWAAVYSDSASDLPLFAGTPRPVLVNPSERTLRRVTRALGRSPEVRTWR